MELLNTDRDQQDREAYQRAASEYHFEPNTETMNTWQAALAYERGKSGWRPIAEAPKDGTWLVLLSTVEGVTCGYWGPTYFDMDHTWVKFNHRSDSIEVEGEVTHFQTLPSPPATQPQESE